MNGINFNFHEQQITSYLRRRCELVRKYCILRRLSLQSSSTFVMRKHISSYLQSPTHSRYLWISSCIIFVSYRLETISMDNLAELDHQNSHRGPTWLLCSDQYARGFEFIYTSLWNVHNEFRYLLMRRYSYVNFSKILSRSCFVENLLHSHLTPHVCPCSHAKKIFD